MGDETVPGECPCPGSMGSCELVGGSLVGPHWYFGGLQMADALLCWVGAQNANLI